MGRYGLKSGYGKFQNIQAGTSSVTLNGDGDGTANVTFKRKFKNVPVVMVNAQTSDDTITTNPSNITKTGFTIHCDGATAASTSIIVGYHAHDDPSGTGFA